MAWFALLVLPWFVAIVAKSGGVFFAKSVGDDLLSKVLSGQESHGAPPGLYLLLYWVTFWPGAVLTGFALPAIWAARRQPSAQFLLAWLVPSWIVFELVITKLPHYVLPLYPAVAILLAGAVEVRVLARQRWLAHGTMGWFVLPCAVGIAMIAGFVAIGGEPGLIVWPFAAAAMVLGLMAWQFFDVDNAESSLLYATATSIVVAIAFYAVTVPRLPQLFPAASLARIVAQSDCKYPLAAAAGYHEPSLVFLVGTSTRLTDGPGAADFLRHGGCRFAFIESHHQRAFVQRAEAIRLRYASGPRIEAINISGGRRITIAVYRSEGAP
jgi:4-amino-4-deoxy-L-arabinose transferase-like glycosyltransferase